ncbi:MAG: thioredoxin family protein [Chloroflexota bacterium]
MSPEILHSELILRLVWALGLIGMGLGLYGLGNRLILARAKGRALGLESARRGVPVLLYFTTPTCAPCKTVQRPAIQHILEQVGERMQVVEIDASNRPDIASHWGVMSVPTTFVIDAQGQPRHVNHGVAPAEKLLRQLNDIF